MGQANKTRQKEKRAKEKRSKKEAKAALYASQRDAGKNGKDKNQTKRNSNRLIQTISHPTGPCHNIGCIRCSNLFSEGGPMNWVLVQRNAGRVANGLKAI